MWYAKGDVLEEDIAIQAEEFSQNQRERSASLFQYEE